MGRVEEIDEESVGDEVRGNEPAMYVEKLTGHGLRMKTPRTMSFGGREYRQAVLGRLVTLRVHKQIETEWATLPCIVRDAIERSAVATLWNDVAHGVPCARS
jgi:hypothetical protein